MKMKTVYIYALCNPDSEEIRYVGKSVDPFYRLWGHIHEARASKKVKNQQKSEWIKNLLLQGEKPKLKILEEVLTEEWEQKEIYWIDKCINEGHKLLNITKGGKTGIVSDKCRKALSNCKTRDQKKGFKHSEETKRIIKEKRALQVITTEHKLNISKGSINKIRIKEVTFLGEEIIWESLSEVARNYKVSVPTIINYLKSKVKKQKIQSKFYQLN